jgi:protein-S-isoprenylcysteine O-methyltransferase Ste14
LTHGGAPRLDAKGESGADPRARYQERLDRHLAERAAHERRHISFGNLRGLTFCIAAGLAWLAWTEALSWWWLTPMALLFGALVLLHERVLRRRAHADLAIRWNRRGIDRLEHRWAGTGHAGERYADPDHPYSGDLDLFGRAGLFERVSACRFRQGADRLAGWLTAPTRPAEALVRQRAVRELQPDLVFREELALLVAEVPDGIDFAGLATWGRDRRRLSSALRIPLLVVSLLVLVALGLLFTSWWIAAMAIAAPIVGLLSWWYRKDAEQTLGSLDRRARDLELLAVTLRRIESRAFESTSLASVKERLLTGGQPASAAIARLRLLADLWESRRNQFFAPFAVALLLPVHLALAVEDWRESFGGSVQGWIDALAEFEALQSLAAYAFENPNDPWPDLVDAPGGVSARGLAHPLLEGAIANDVGLGVDPRALIISGSNMAGKSTYLRSIGVNVVLALAGGPVRAESMTVSFLQVGATLRIQDSLERGQSRFFAEVRRIRQILALASAGPVLFLLDEIFHGTNSRDRGLGAEAVLRELLRRGAIGLVTTHDLSLTPIAERVGGGVINGHFRDDFEHGRMTFDYRLRSGVVPSSNALAIMRSVGIDVEDRPG